MKLTDEQSLIVNSRSEALKVIAFAGAGKTSTLRAYAEKRRDERLLYLAFNKSICEEAKAKFPPNVQCVTTHALAFRSFGAQYKHKLKPSVRANQVARVLGLNPNWLPDLIHSKSSLQVMLHFLSSPCFSFDEFRTEQSGQYLASELASAEDLWEAMIDVKTNAMPMLHDGYLKLYQLSSPLLRYDCILFDEAQDANPVTLSIVKTQPVPRVFVGDPHQQIYQFRRAENAMEDPSLVDTLFLTESFRFRENIADAANSLLKLKREEKRVLGGRKRAPSQTRAFLSRGNASIFTKAAELAKSKKPLHFVGGIDGYRLPLLHDIWRLRADRKSEIEDHFVRHFEDFEQLAKYADAQNERDLSAWVNVINNHANWVSIPEEIRAIQCVAVEKDTDADLSLATAHKSKGLEFGTIEIAPDFPSSKRIEEPIDIPNNYPQGWLYGPTSCPSLWTGSRFNGLVVLPEEELNLRYVVVTRAEGALTGSTWGDPPIQAINSYVAKYPRFVFVGDEDQIKINVKSAVKSKGVNPKEVTKNLMSRENDLASEDASAVSSQLNLDQNKSDEAIEKFNSELPQWNWKWIFDEALKLRGDKTERDVAIAELMKKTGLNQTRIENFLVQSGLAKKPFGKVRGVLPGTEQETKIASDTYTLSELVESDFGERISVSVARFNTPGWFSVGKTPAECPRCGSTQLEGYRRPYKDANGKEYFYWALVCLWCRDSFEPANLDDGSRKALTKLVASGQSKVTSTISESNPAPSGSKLRPRAPVMLPASQDDLQVGKVIFHDRFGKGQVTGLSGDHARYQSLTSGQIEVNFETGGSKLFDLRVAKFYVHSK